MEQKNSSLVRAYLGFDCLDIVAQTLTLNALYDHMCATPVLSLQRRQELEALRDQTHPRQLRQTLYDAIEQLFALPKATPGKPENVYDTWHTKETLERRTAWVTLSFDLARCRRAEDVLRSGQRQNVAQDDQCPQQGQDHQDEHNVQDGDLAPSQFAGAPAARTRERRGFHFAFENRIGLITR